MLTEASGPDSVRRPARSCQNARMKAGDPYTPRGYNEGVRGYSKNKSTVLSRLRRIEGQVRGIEKMVDEDRYCIDVLTQVNAARAALESVALQLLSDHTEHCVTEAIRSGGGRAKVRELNDAVERLVRS